MNLNGEQQTLFYDLLINFYANNPALYDKSHSRYAFPLERHEKLQILSSYLKELDINVSVPEIADTWEHLVKKFKRCLADENAAGSGSATKDHYFPYYKDLMFLKPAVEHRPALSTASFNTLSAREISRSGSTSSCSYSGAASSSSSASPRFFGPSVQPPSFNPLIRPMKVPPYDEPAKKYIKLMDKENESITAVGKKIMETLDKVNTKIDGSTTEKSIKPQRKSDQLHIEDASTYSIDYTNHLTQALSKVPVGCEAECMEYVLQTLEEFHNKN